MTTQQQIQKQVARKGTREHPAARAERHGVRLGKVVSKVKVPAK